MGNAEISFGNNLLQNKFSKRKQQILTNMTLKHMKLEFLNVSLVLEILWHRKREKLYIICFFGDLHVYALPFMQFFIPC